MPCSLMAEARRTYQEWRWVSEAVLDAAWTYRVGVRRANRRSNLSRGQEAGASCQSIAPSPR